MTTKIETTSWGAWKRLLPRPIADVTHGRYWATTHFTLHAHLLIRTGGRPLSDLMRKILSGYAISFNRRHKRHGYLFQNRYKSILCQEEEYLLELAAEETLTRREELKRQGWDLKRLVTEVCGILSVAPEDLQKKGRANSLSYAKGLICYLGHSRLGLTGKELARYFNISQPSVSQAIQRGERFAKKNKLKLLS